MRELDKRVAAAVQRLLPGAVLLVGARSNALNAVTAVERPREITAAARFDAALWFAPADALELREGLLALRGKLAPGAPIVLAVRSRPPVLQQVRGMLGGPTPPPIELATLCGALLAAGLAMPRLHEGPRGYHLLSASLPRDLCALDDLFTQPPPG